MRKFSSLLLIGSMLSGCSLAPDFTLPNVSAPNAYKSEAKPDSDQKGTWQEAAPMEEKDRGQWWKIFGDEKLSALEAEAIQANPNLKAASSRLEQARATVRANASTIFPTIDIGGNAVRAKSGSTANTAFGGAPGNFKPYTKYSAMGVASYEVDIFGRVRDNESALSFAADSQEALYRSTLLALQADVADNYFQLRALDAERALLRDTVTIRTEAHRIMQKRFNVGAVNEQDISRTEAELATTQAELLALERTRSAYENALAVLLGKVPSEFTFEEAPLETVPPHIPAGLPSTLLLRRPDISQAQALMASANKRIGVARTAYFPTLNLTADFGYESTSFSDLFKWSGRSWALGQTGGSALAMNILNSGRTAASVDVAFAAYDEAVANYRERVLVAFKDVEDGLTAQRLLAQQSEQQNIAAAASTRTTNLTQKRYDQGDVNYFELVDAQRNSLAAERAAIQVRGERLRAAVTLIRALGGGWGDLPAEAAPAAPPEKSTDALPEILPLLPLEAAPLSTPQP